MVDIPKNDVVAYIDKKMNDQLPDLESQGDVIRFDSNRDKYVEQKELVAIDLSVFGTEQLESQKGTFLKAMNEYEENAEPENKSHVKIKNIWSKFADTSTNPGGTLKLEGKTTWADVLTQINEAENAYKNRAKKKTVADFVTRCFRKFSGNAKYFQSWLDVLPQGDYSSIICGGFKMIFVAAAKISEVREEIFDLLGSIPHTVADAADYSAIFYRLPSKYKAELERCIASLYVGVLKGLDRVLRWFTKRATRKIVSALLKGDRYECKVIDNKAQIETLAKQVKAQATRCSYIRQAISDAGIEKRMAKAADQAKERSILWNTRQDDMEKSLQDFREETALTSRQTNDGVSRIEDKLQEMKQQIDSVCGPGIKVQLNINVKNSFYILLQDSPWLKSQQRMEQDKQIHATVFPQGQETQLQLEATPSMPVPGDFPTEIIPLSVSRMLHEKQGMSKTSILDRLSHSVTEISVELESCLASGARLDLEEQDRVAYITRHPKIKHLLSSDTSECLLVNGNTGLITKISSVSFLSAVVAQFFQKLGIPVAYFFCGRHNCDFYSGPLTGPSGMLRRLTSQIVSYCKEEWIEDVGAEDLDDIDGLLKLLTKMMAIQPHNQAVFFVVDTISLYYTDEWMMDTDRVVSGLLELAHSSNGTIKVLFTSPTIAVDVQLMLDEEQVLRAPQEMVHGQRMGFGLRQASETLG